MQAVRLYLGIHMSIVTESNLKFFLLGWLKSLKFQYCVRNIYQFFMILY